MTDPDPSTPPSPEEIPPHTFVEIAFDVDAFGNELAIVEGIDIMPRPGEDARDAAIRTVAEMVDGVAGVDPFGRPYRYLRARIVGDSDHRSVVIHRDGRLFVTVDDSEPADLVMVGRPAARTGGGDADRPRSEALGKAADTLLRTDEAAPLPGSGSEADSAPDSAERDSAGQAAPVGPRALLRGEVRKRRSTRPVSRRTAEPDLSTESAEPAEPTDPVAARVERRARLMEEARRAAVPARGSTRWRSRQSKTSKKQARPGASSSRDAGRATSGRRFRSVRPVALIVVSALVVVSALLLVADRIATTPAPAAGAAGLPLTPPPGWAREAAWSTGPLAPEAGTTVGLGDAVGYVTAERELVVADLATGEARWRLDLPPGDIRGTLARTLLDSTDSVSLHLGDRLYAWSAADGRPVAATDVPPQAQVTYLGAAPLVGVGPSTVAVVTSGGLTEIAVPEGAFALAAREDSSVTAASPAGWWHLRAGRPAGSPRDWENPSADSRPADSRPTVTGYLGDSIVLVYPAFRDLPPEVVVHTDLAGDVRASFRGPALAAGSARGSWVPSPSGTWGVLGRTLVDVKAGSVADLGAWQTDAVTSGHAFGRVSGQQVVTGPGASPAVLPEGTQVPEMATADGAVIRLRGHLTDETGREVLPEGTEGGFVVLPAR